MSNTLDEKFLKLYRSIKKEVDTNELYKFINYSFLKIYLHIKGREKYTRTNISTLKRLVYSKKELFIAKSRLNKVLKSGTFNCLVVINESSHLKHALPLKEDLKGFAPLFITNKKKYIEPIAKGFETEAVVYIPKIIVPSSKFKPSQIENLFSENKFDISEATTIAEMLNDTYKNYDLTKNFLNTILVKNKIQFAYIFNDLLFTGRVIIDICNKKGIRTYYLMHGLLSDEFIENLHICSNYLVFGDYTRGILVKKDGITNDDIITLGAPYLREQLKAKQPVFFENEITNHLPKYKKIALVLLSGPGHTVSEEHHKEIIKVIQNLIEQSENKYYFLFKLHSKDSIGYYHNITNGANVGSNYGVYSFNHFQGKETIFDWIKAADVIITGASTTALEAMYMGKPVVTIDLKNEFENETEFIQQEATYHCKSQEEFFETMNELQINNFKISNQAKGVINQYFADFSNIQKFHKEILPQ